MAGLKYSRQREAIKEFLAARCDHPTADVIYEGIKEIYPHISLGTVYRNLSLLIEIGAVKKITTGEGRDHFDGNTTPHNHFVCKHCGSVIDLHMNNIDHINQTAGEHFNGHIDGYTVLFHGTCGNCLEQS